MSRFTEVELEVMRILWAHGELKPSEIIARYPRPINNSAVRSFLTVLLRKGHVARRKVGKAYYYQASTQPDQSFGTMLRKLVDTFFGGSTEALLCRLIRSEQLTNEQLLELKRMAEREQAEIPAKAGNQDEAGAAPSPAPTLKRRKGSRP